MGKVQITAVLQPEEDLSKKQASSMSVHLFDVSCIASMGQTQVCYLINTFRFSMMDKLLQLLHGIDK